MSAPLLGGLFAGAGAGATASVVGSVLSGVAAGWMKGAQEKAAEKREIRAQERREQTYAGLDDATQYWKSDTAAPGRKPAEPLNQRSDAIGERYKVRPVRSQTTGPRYTYDRDQRRIVTN